MLKDYLRACWRGVLHHKVATLINLGGLALGLAVFIALTFYVHREFSWDAHWEGAERIYRASGQQETPGGNSAAVFTTAPWVMAEALQERNPDAFETWVRVYSDYGTLVVYDEEYAQRSMHYVESSFLELLQLQTLRGSLADVFSDPRAIAISERVAETAFGTRSPLDETLSFRGREVPVADFVVKAVYRLPEPSTLASMQILALLTPGALPQPNARLDLWNITPVVAPPQGGQASAQPAPPQPFYVQHYFKLQEGVDAALLEADLRSLMDAGKYMEFFNNKTRFSFQKLRDTHLMPSPFFGGDNVQRLWIFAAIGALVLLISGCNFVLLATLRQVDRQRELGLRKTLGGTAGQLLLQHLLDAFCLTLAATCLAVALLQVALPQAQVALDWPVELDLLQWRSIGAILLIAAGFTLLSSTWPALVMARGRPVRLLRDGAGAAMGGGTALRQLLVGIQFVIVVVLLLATVVVWLQINYTRNRDRGYSFDDVVGIRLTSTEAFQKAEVLLPELGRIPQVEVVAVGSLSPGALRISAPVRYRYTAADGSTKSVPMQQYPTGHDYFRVLSVPLLAGREFTAELEGITVQPTTPEAQLQVQPVVINAAAVRELGLATPELALGQLLETDLAGPNGQTRTMTLRVIGVVADTQFSSAMMPPEPQVYPYSHRNGTVALRLVPGADGTAVTAALKSTWTAVMGDLAFSPIDPAQSEANILRREEFEARIISGSTLLAIVIALLGLYGLVTATVQRRVREIALRKVLGAERRSVVGLFLWQFSRPVLAANLVAWPLGLWGVQQWLQRFPFRLDLGVIVASALAASVAALLIAWLSVGLLTLRAAGARPAPALRCE